MIMGRVAANFIGNLKKKKDLQFIVYFLAVVNVFQKIAKFSREAWKRD